MGLLFIAASPRGLRYLEYMDRRSIKRMIARHAETLPDATWEPSLLELKPVVDQLESYFCGGITEFDVRLDATGTDFQRLVWKALIQIPYAQSRTYGEVAKAIGQPRSARAVGLANNQNPIAIVVPCHRVIGAKGSLAGYSGGVQRKKWLLAHEARFAKLAGTGSELLVAAAAPAASRRGSR
jgi:methylated-DNA-[protein]-cysteine S-methyltransferase